MKITNLISLRKACLVAILLAILCQAVSICFISLAEPYFRHLYKSHARRMLLQSDLGVESVVGGRFFEATRVDFSRLPTQLEQSQVESRLLVKMPLQTRTFVQVRMGFPRLWAGVGIAKFDSGSSVVTGGTKFALGGRSYYVPAVIDWTQLAMSLWYTFLFALFAVLLVQVCISRLKRFLMRTKNLALSVPKNSSAR